MGCDTPHLVASFRVERAIEKIPTITPLSPGTKRTLAWTHAPGDDISVLPFFVALLSCIMLNHLKSISFPRTKLWIIICAKIDTLRWNMQSVFPLTWHGVSTSWPPASRVLREPEENYNYNTKTARKKTLQNQSLNCEQIEFHLVSWSRHHTMYGEYAFRQRQKSLLPVESISNISMAIFSPARHSLFTNQSSGKGTFFRFAS